VWKPPNKLGSLVDIDWIVSSRKTQHSS